MPLSEFYPLVEELLAKKADADEEDLTNKKNPAAFAPFVLDYLLKTKGVKRLAQRDLLRLIPTLYRLYHNKSPYAVAVARLLHMFSSSPAVKEGGVLVGRYTRRFKPLIEKYAASREARQLAPESESELAVTGGEALLTDVLSEFYPDVKDHPVYSWHFLRHLKPAKVSVDDYVLAVLHWYAHTQLHKDHHQFWRLLAREEPL